MNRLILGLSLFVMSCMAMAAPSVGGLNTIKQLEGLSLVPYMEPVSRKLHIGYGHVITNTHAHKPINLAQAHQLLLQDLKPVEKMIAKHVKVPLNHNQYDALVSFTHNVGVGALQKSTLLKKLNEKDYQGASAQLVRWTKVNKRVVLGLVNRRVVEKALFDLPIEEITVEKVFEIKHKGHMGPLRVEVDDDGVIFKASIPLMKWRTKYLSDMLNDEPGIISATEVVQ